ncbi:hypothetical protein AK830_g2591 [Neonectria ditissima]|uniref:Heterokaryon incompatibility domain-containing protein n=1 Tax=Neonectria ditissima TaxID=78410 RepID=A0A0P7BUV9_9HYPO|nr:hypothetical protein AK830_g2591 [Neonectria ditissima]
MPSRNPTQASGSQSGNSPNDPPPPTKNSFVNEQWGSRPMFQYSHGLSMGDDDIQEGTAILEALMDADRFFTQLTGLHQALEELGRCCGKHSLRGGTGRRRRKAPHLEEPTLQENEIRLIRLNVAKSHQFNITFQRVLLTDPALPKFVALSYVWGDLKDTLPLEVGNRTIAATRNLHAVLQSLVSSNFDQLLWIDALCINQHDLQERAAQVGLMGDIYSRALYVLAFLSPVSAPFDVGLGFLEAAAENSELHYEPSLTPHITVNGLTGTSEVLRDSLIAFFAAPWWTRVWTVQEYALAEQVVFQCGSRQIDAKIVGKAFLSLANHERKCCWAARRAADGNARGFLDYPSKANGGLSLFAATLRMNNLNYLTDTETFGSLDILGAISLFRTRHCTDPRDRVFGISGLHVKGGEKPQSLVPTDYAASTALVYRNLAMAVIEASQTLDVLSHVLRSSAVQQRTAGLSSWVPDWDAAMDDPYHLIYRERMTYMRHFGAAGDTKPVWKLNGSGSVTTRGFQTTKIVATAPGYPGSNSTTGGKALLDTWRKLAGLPSDPNAQSPKGETDEARREWAFQRSLCGNISLQQWAGDSCNYSRAYHTWYAWFTHEESASLPSEARENAREFDYLVQTTSLARRFFVTEDGRLGFGPESAQAGDVVAILSGGKVPYVLRSVASSEDSGVSVFEFLGDAFVDQVMVGEEVATLRCQFEDVTLV